MRNGLVLEGGALRAMFTCGVLDVLMEGGVRFDGMVTVSAGACFGCNFKSNQAGRAIRYNMEYAGDRRFCSVHSWLTTGNMFNAEFGYHTIPERLDPFDYEAFRKSPVEFHIVATNIRTGKAEHRRFDECDDRCIEFMRASAAMPIAQKIVRFDGEKYLDGGISDSIPLRLSESLGFGKNLVVLTQPAGFVKKPNPLLPLIKLRYGVYPNLVEAVRNRHVVYNEETRYAFSQAERGNAFVVCPREPLGISHTEKNPAELKRVYDEGRRVCEGAIVRIKEFLGQ